MSYFRIKRIQIKGISRALFTKVLIMEAIAVPTFHQQRKEKQSRIREKITKIEDVILFHQGFPPSCFLIYMSEIIWKNYSKGVLHFRLCTETLLLKAITEF